MTIVKSCLITLRTFFLVSLLAGSFAGAASAQSPTIQPEDVLSIQVAGEPKLSGEYAVDKQGGIMMPMLGKVKVAGLTPAQAQTNLTNGLKRYLKLFNVSVAVVGGAAERVLVYGEVGKPGPVKMKPGASLLDVLAEAGQPNADADTRIITVIRKNGEKLEVDLEEAIEDRSKNLILQDGDTVSVPAKTNRTVLVDGEVKDAGHKSIDSARTAYAALMSAGPTESADWTRVLLRRKGVDVPLTVDLTAVRSGRMKDDLELQPGDQITLMSRHIGMATLRGEVTNPGEKQLMGETQLLDFIATAGGGFTEKSDRTQVQIIRSGQPMQKFNLEEVANGIVSADDPAMTVQPGDIIFVPNDSKRRFIIVGGVKKPGGYPVREGMTLLDAVTDAEGFTSTASHKQFVLIPESPADERLQSRRGEKDEKSRRKKDDEQLPQGMIAINYEKLLKGDPTQNVVIRPGDRILIPEEQPRDGNRRSGLGKVLDLLPIVGLFR